MTELAVIEQAADLKVYGERDEIKELGYRLQQMMPSAQSLTQGEALAVAQIAHAHGLDPFNGEVWGIKSHNGKWYGVMVGIKGLRKAARRQIQAESGSFWLEFRIVDPADYDEPKTSKVIECQLRDSITMTSWKKLVHEMVEAGAPYQEAVKMFGDPPVVIGVGIAKSSDKSKMHKQALAKKRAEADAIKQRFDVEFGEARYDERYVDNDSPMIIDGKAVEMQHTSQILRPEKPKKEPAQLIEELGFETEPEPDDPTWLDRPIAPENLKAQLAEWAKMYVDQDCQDAHRKMLASHLGTTFDGDDTKRYEWSKYYLGAASTKEIDDALVLASLKTLFECSNWGDIPSEVAIEEVKNSHAYALKNQGQQELL